MQRGGKRPGSGRRSKSYESDLIQRLGPLAPAAFKALKDGLTKGNTECMKLWFNYMYGKPQEKMDLTTGGESIPIKISLNLG